MIRQHDPLADADSSRVSTRHGFRSYVALCAFAGLRKGEAAGVQIGDIDFTARRLTVARQLQRDGSTFVARLPKYGSERAVYLPDELVEMLRSHIEKFLPEAPPADAWLFTVGDGPMYDNDVDWRWRATRASAGLPHVRLHDLRHFYASGLIAAGCDVVTVQRAGASIGHDDPEHLQPPVAHGGGSDPSGCGGPHARGASGLRDSADRRASLH